VHGPSVGSSTDPSALQRTVVCSAHIPLQISGRQVGPKHSHVGGRRGQRCVNLQRSVDGQAPGRHQLVLNDVHKHSSTLLLHILGMKQAKMLHTGVYIGRGPVEVQQ
jgi:hypothetical protein